MAIEFPHDDDDTEPVETDGGGALGWAAEDAAESQTNPGYLDRVPGSVAFVMGFFTCIVLLASLAAAALALGI